MPVLDVFGKLPTQHARKLFSTDFIWTSGGIGKPFLQS